MTTERYFADATAEQLRDAAHACREVGRAGGDPGDWDSPLAVEARRLTAELGWSWDFCDWADAASVLEREAELADQATEERSMTKTLADYLDKMPVDRNGSPIADSDGRIDDPADYEVLEYLRTDDGFRALVRGPSGLVDFVVDDVTGSRIYRDADYATLFETGEGDCHWKLEDAPDGLLCVTSNAETRRVVEHPRHLGWDADTLRNDLVTSGVPADLIERYITQAGL